jgi:hypothetical protein
MAISDYLIKKGSFKFSQILSEGYTVEEKPVILNQTTKADGSIKTVYAQYTTLIISLKFGNLDGETIAEYVDELEDGEYEIWNPNTREYETYNFVVDKGSLSMISSRNGERYSDFEVILTKSSEVTSWSI